MSSRVAHLGKHTMLCYDSADKRQLKKGADIMVKLTRNKLLFLGVVAVIILGGMAVVLPPVSAQPAQPQNATYEGTGNGSDVWSRYHYALTTARIFKMNVSGTLYDSYCLDPYTPINQTENLTINGPLSEGNQSVNWTKVNYILYTYNYSTAEDKNLEAAAIQTAIWYFTTEPYEEFNESWSKPYPKYQFMSDNMTDNITGPSDFYDGIMYLNEGNESVVRERAFEIINDTKANVSDFKFPTSIELNSSEEYVLKDQTVTLTATVYDQQDPAQPLPEKWNVTVKFAITEGNGTLNPDNGTTNETGQVQVNFTGTDANATTVVAWVEGSYGTLLHGEMYTPPRQNVSTITLIPRSIEDLLVLPIPEQSTIVLTSTGVLALVGYVTYSRRKKEE